MQALKILTFAAHNKTIIDDCRCKKRFSSTRKLKLGFYYRYSVKKSRVLSNSVSQTLPLFHAFCFLFRQNGDIDMKFFSTIYQRSSDPFYIVGYYIKQVTTSWTYYSNSQSRHFSVKYLLLTLLRKKGALQRRVLGSKVVLNGRFIFKKLPHILYLIKSCYI